MAKLDKVNEELKRLCEEGIIRPVTQPTDWLSNMLIKEKPNGKLSIFIDPSQTINKAIKRPKYTIPKFNSSPALYHLWRTDLPTKEFSLIQVKYLPSQECQPRQTRPVCATFPRNVPVLVQVLPKPVSNSPPIEGPN